MNAIVSRPGRRFVGDPMPAFPAEVDRGPDQEIGQRIANLEQAVSRLAQIVTVQQGALQRVQPQAPAPQPEQPATLRVDQSKLQRFFD